MRTYRPKDMAEILQIDAVTVRKYSQKLEAAGYLFQKDENTYRIYNDTDIKVFRSLIEEKKKAGVSLESAINSVVAAHSRRDISRVDTEKNDIEPLQKEIAALKEIVSTQNQLLQELTKRLDQQDKTMTNRLDRQEQVLMNRDEALMSMIRDMQETKRLIAAAEEKKSFFAKLFKK